MNMTVNGLTSPFSFVLFLLLMYSLVGLENGISWGKYNTDISTYTGVIALFITGFAISSYLMARVRINSNAGACDNFMGRDKVLLGRFYILVFASVLFLFLKLFKLGSIPLFSSDPTIRSTGESLGGVVDYPVRLISLLGITAFYIYKCLGDKKLLCVVFLSYVVNFILLNRSELVFITFGLMLVYFKGAALSLGSLIKIVVALCFVLFGFVSVLAVFRYGADNLGYGLSIFELAIWVLHGDLTGALNFGSYVSDSLRGSMLYGRYVLGEYFSIVFPGYGVHGAEYLRDEFLPERNTAQSVAVPFNYFIDFGYAGVAFFSLLCGVGYSYLRNVFLSNRGAIGSVLYIVFSYNLFLSVRNGIFPANPMFLYYLMALCFVFRKRVIGYEASFLQSCFELIFVFSLLLSLFVGLSRV